MESVDDMVFSMIEEVRVFEPSTFRSDLIPALEAVGDASQAIAEAIRLFHPPDPCHPDFLTALDNIEASALSITDTVMWGIDELSGGECVPTAIDEFACKENIDCEWMPDIAGVMYCCRTP